MTKNVQPVDDIYPNSIASPPEPLEPPGSELEEQGRNIRGVYIPVPRLRRWGVKRLTNWIVNGLKANGVIIDVKDDRGRVTFTKELPNTKGSIHGQIRHMEKLVTSLQENGVYVIGRIVCFRDNHLPRIKPSAAVLDSRTKRLWRDQADMTWLDPYSRVAHEHIATVAKAAEELGFDEIQLDYVRFPVESESKYAKFRNREDGAKRYQAIASLLARVDKRINIPLSIDVFGLTAYNPGDPDGLGQSLEHLAPYIDAISPMLYLANWPRHAWENPKPSKTYSLIYNAVRRIRNRLGDQIAVRPLLQAFKFRALYFGDKFIHNQINAAETAGSSGHLFWNQFGAYRPVSVVWRRIESSSDDGTNESPKITPPKSRTSSGRSPSLSAP